MRRAWLAIPLIVVSIGLLVASRQRETPFFVSGFIEADEIRVGSRVGGRVREVRVTEGQRVAAGDVLVALEPFVLLEQLAEAQAALAAREAQMARMRAGYLPEEIEQVRARRDRHQAVLERLIAGPRPVEIEILENKLDAARAQLVKAEIEEQRIRALFEAGQAAKEEMDEVTRVIDIARASFLVAQGELTLAREGTRAEEIAEARAALAEAEQALQVLVRGYRVEEIAEAEANVRAAQAAVASIERQQEELTVRAPGPSVVEAVELQPGDLVPANTPVISLMDAQQLWVRAYVPENRIDLNVGQMVVVRVDAHPGRDFAGHVSYVSRNAEFTPSNIQTPEERSKQVFRIKVMLDEGGDVLRPGMSADVYLEPPA